MDKDIRVSLAVLTSRVGQTEDNLARAVKWIEASHLAGSRIICFPEASITGYANRTDIRDVAEPVPGPSTDALCRAADQYDIVILAGIVEDAGSGAVHASHVVIKPDRSIGIYRKLHISPQEETAFTPGEDIPLFEVDGMRFGIQLCYDGHFPELTGNMAARGADALFIPHASPRSSSEEKLASWMRHLPARAYDNSVYILACNPAGTNGSSLRFPGLSLAIGPSGRILEKDISGKEGLLTVDLSSSDLAAVRSNPMHYFLPGRRPELY